jgi:hypothetical protein
MLAIIDFFLQITLRRRGPEDLPDSRFLLLLSALCYVVVQLFLALPIYSLSILLFRSILVDVALLCACVCGLLWLAHHLSRSGQTLTAFFGTGALLGLLMLPFNYWLDAQSVPGQPALLPTAGLLAIVSWSLVVNGHIFARALSIPFVAGIMLSLAYFFLNYLVFWQLGPPPA